MFLLYLDQNYASRFAKHLLGQPEHQPFDLLYAELLSYEVICPASPFHVLELREGYLKPAFLEFFPKLQRGYWVRPWEAILSAQRERRGLVREDFLTQDGSWEEAASLDALAWIVDLPLEGKLAQRIKAAQLAIVERLDLAPEDTELPFVLTLAQLLAFRSLNTQRQPRSSDLADLLIAASIRPYVDIFATDRFVREAFDRLGQGQGVYSGRHPDVQRLREDLRSLLGKDEEKEPSRCLF
jgi:hypothetical protein